MLQVISYVQCQENMLFLSYFGRTCEENVLAGET